MNIPRRKHSIPPEIFNLSPQWPYPRPNRPKSGRSGRGRARSRPSPLAGRERPDSVQPGGIRPFCPGNGQILFIPAVLALPGHIAACRGGSGRLVRVTAGSRPAFQDPAVLSWSGRIPSSLPGSSCFGRRTGSPARNGSGNGKRIWPIFLKTDEGYFCICITCHVN
jgi:hypothetical protein